MITLSRITYGTDCDVLQQHLKDSFFLCTLKILGVFPERQLGPFGYTMHRFSIIFGLFVKRGILVARQHLVLFGKVEFQMVYFGKAGGFLVGQL